MAGEKYIVAAADNPLQIAVRNILNPAGYLYAAHCSDPVSLMKLVRSYSPDFIVVDLDLETRDLKPAVETVDDELLCACILLAGHRNMEIAESLERYRAVSLCSRQLQKDILVNTAELAVLNYRRMAAADRKLKEMTENYETRKSVERAKWILMKRDGISEDEAYDRIRKKSMDSRTPMKSIADALIFTYEINSKREG